MGPINYRAITAIFCGPGFIVMYFWNGAPALLAPVLCSGLALVAVGVFFTAFCDRRWKSRTRAS